MTPRRFDIAVVGGGPVGVSLACALAPLGYSVVVVEAVPAGAALQPSFDERSLALNLASCRILEALGVWPFLSENTTAIREVVVTEMGRPGRVALRPLELGMDAFGHVVTARELGAGLLKKLASLEEVSMLQPARVAGIETGPTHVALELEGESAPERLEIQLVVAADGTHSAVRTSLGIPVEEKDYGQSALVCNVVTEREHQGRAFERMTPNGPCALLPQTEGRSGLVWCDTHRRIEELLGLPEEEFLTLAAARSGHVLGEFLRGGQRSSHTLRLCVSRSDIASRVVVIGNAAHTIHPAGAQGFNLGLRDVASLAEVLFDAGASGRRTDPGDPALLGRYSDWRRPDRDRTVHMSHGMVSLFASPRRITRSLRTAGLYAHALVPALRRRLASQAMGFRGRVPRLAWGQPLGGSGSSGS